MSGEAHPRWLFVYGTLMSDFHNHRRYARDAVSIREASCAGTLYHLPEGYPVLLDEGGEREARGRVRGEALAFLDFERALRRLDRLEGYDRRREEGNLFVRARRRIQIAGVGARWGWVYIAPPEKASEIARRGTAVPDGDWRKFASKLQRPMSPDP
ncbi:MAG: gamma-glutamylcyclotransferase family protein [Vicinamibacteria bacterium]